MMLHVDEGGLHAYLDGALDEYPAADAARIRAHLDACETCRERLDAERLIRDEAAQLLGVDAPRVEAPTFEELRSYVRARAEQVEGRSSTRLQRMGWAASVVLALGLGWVLRGGPGDVASAPPADGDSEVVASAAPAGAVAESTSPPTDPEPVLAVDDAPDADAQRAIDAPEADSQRAIDATLARAPTPDAGLLRPSTALEPVTIDVAALDGPASVDPTVVSPSPDGDVPPLPTPTLDTSGVPSADRFVELSTISVEASDPGAADELERPTSPAEVVTSASQSTAAPGLAVFGRQGDDAGTGTAEPSDEESYSLVVPDLEVLEVRFRGGIQPEGQVVVQRLESGGTLEVIHLPTNIEPSSLEAADPEDRQLVLQTSSGWIVMRAPVDEAELMEFMRRLLAED